MEQEEEYKRFVALLQDISSKQAEVTQSIKELSGPNSITEANNLIEDHFYQLFQALNVRKQFLLDEVERVAKAKVTTLESHQLMLGNLYDNSKKALDSGAAIYQLHKSRAKTIWQNGITACEVPALQVNSKIFVEFPSSTISFMRTIGSVRPNQVQQVQTPAPTTPAQPLQVKVPHIQVQIQSPPSPQAQAQVPPSPQAQQTPSIKEPQAEPQETPKTPTFKVPSVKVMQMQSLTPQQPQIPSPSQSKSPRGPQVLSVKALSQTTAPQVQVSAPQASQTKTPQAPPAKANHPQDAPVSDQQAQNPVPQVPQVTKTQPPQPKVETTQPQTLPTQPKAETAQPQWLPSQPKAKASLQIQTQASAPVTQPAPSPQSSQLQPPIRAQSPTGRASPSPGGRASPSPGGRVSPSPGGSVSPSPYVRPVSPLPKQAVAAHPVQATLSGPPPPAFFIVPVLHAGDSSGADRLSMSVAVEGNCFAFTPTPAKYASDVSIALDGAKLTCVAVTKHPDGRSIKFTQAFSLPFSPAPHTCEVTGNNVRVLLPV